MEIDGNTNILHRLIKTYVAQSDWEKVEETYRKYISLAESHGPILRDVGMALCKNNKHEYNSKEFNEGLKLLQKAINMDETDVEALSNLGGVYFKNRDKNNDYLKNSRDCYKKAHIIAPENPYPLGNYIACELLMKKDPDILAYFKPIIERAQNLCVKQIEVKTNIPWAYFDLGTFYLYLGKLEESKNYFEQAIQNSSYDWMVSTCRERIQTFIDKGIDIKYLKDINTLLKKGEKEVRDRNNTAA
jgi:tetratricopeptide (TPR) repeat protein